MSNDIAQDWGEGNSLILFVELPNWLKEDVGVGAGVMVEERDSEDPVRQGARVRYETDYEAGARESIFAGRLRRIAPSCAAIDPLQIYPCVAKRTGGILFRCEYHLLGHICAVVNKYSHLWIVSSILSPAQQ